MITNNINQKSYEKRLELNTEVSQAESSFVDLSSELSEIDNENTTFYKKRLREDYNNK